MGMKQKTCIRTNRLMGYIVCLGIAVLILLGYFFELIPVETKILIPAAIFTALMIPATIYKCIRYDCLTDVGVESHCFGKIVKQLPWEQVGCVCIVHEEKNANTEMLLIIPVDCEKYDEKKWSYKKYIKQFRGRVVSADHNKRNREFIEKRFGPIVDYRNG